MSEYCHMYGTYGYCPQGFGCLYIHAATVPPMKAPGPTNVIIDAVMEMAERHDNGDYTCVVCGNAGTPPLTAKVGEFGSYRQCPNCSAMCFYPLLHWLVEAMIADCRGDYQEFKRHHDEIREKLPEIVKIPFSYEAHRWATVHFAWSLVGPKEAKAALAAIARLRNVKGIVSVGAGSGYVEHVFKTAANDMGLGSDSPSGFECFAYDVQLPVQGSVFSVEVMAGTPQTLINFPDLSSYALLLCWPPFGAKGPDQPQVAYDTVTSFASRRGEFLVSIGDVSSSGDWRFHEVLYTHWEPLREYNTRKELPRWLPQQMALVYAGCDTIGVYRRREVPLQTHQFEWHQVA